MYLYLSIPVQTYTSFPQFCIPNPLCLLNFRLKIETIIKWIVSKQGNKEEAMLYLKRVYNK